MALLNSKKGQGSNYIVAIIYLVLFVFMSMVGVTFTVALLNEYEASSFNTGQMQGAIDGFRNSFYFWDYILVLLVVVLIIGSAVTSYRLRTSAIGFLVTFFMSVFWGFISYFFNYMFIQMYSNEALQSATMYFPRSMIMLTNCHWIMVAFIIFGTLGLYFKRQTEQGEVLS